MIEAEILADSVNEAGDRLTTFRLKYPMAIHAQVMTHRVFCLAGDAMLEFNLPAGSRGAQRVFRMPIAEFVDKWHNGSKPHATRWGTERRYNLRGRLGKMLIRNVNESDMSPAVSNVVNCCVSGVKPVFELTAGKYSVAGSADHRILTAVGWRRIADLRPGVDTVATYGRGKDAEEKKDARRLKKIDGRWVSQWNRKAIPAIAKRQEWKCADCEAVPHELHHVEPVHENPGRAFDESNVVALCRYCHKERHRVQGWQEGNPACVKFVTVDSVRLRGTEQTYDLEIAGEYPNFIANGVVVHNSRNARSRRAMNPERFADDCDWSPEFYGPAAEGSKMHAGPLGPQYLRDECDAIWDNAANDALQHAEILAVHGAHRFFSNVLVSPFAHTDVVLSSTRWAGFFEQRISDAAEPHLRQLALLMHSWLAESVPVLTPYYEWHLPMISAQEREEHRSEVACYISAGRCARVSYGPNMVREWEKDYALGLDMFEKGHWSPFEHQAKPDRRSQCNFTGWTQFRQLIEPLRQSEKYTGPTRRWGNA